MFLLYCREELPGKWSEDLDDFQKLIVLKCLRADKVTNGMQDYVAHHLGQRFIEPQVSNTRGLQSRNCRLKLYNFTMPDHGYNNTLNGIAHIVEHLLTVAIFKEELSERLFSSISYIQSIRVCCLMGRINMA